MGRDTTLVVGQDMSLCETTMLVLRDGSISGLHEDDDESLAKIRSTVPGGPARRVEEWSEASTMDAVLDLMHGTIVYER